jgi:hypothetical protein
VTPHKFEPSKCKKCLTYAIILLALLAGAVAISLLVVL